MKKLAFLSLALTGTISWAIAQSEQEKNRILQETNTAELKKLSNLWQNKQRADKQKALELARRKGWQIFIPMPNGTVAELQRVDETGKPVYYVTQSNLAAAQTTRTDRLWTGGSMGLNLNGQGMIVGEWDGGPVRRTHQEFGTTTSRVIQKDGVSFTSHNGNTEHATHVAGTLIASGVQANAKGMAHQATLWANEWNNDKSEMASQAAEGLILSNHSYGYNSQYLSQWQFGFYDSEAADWDQIAVNAPFYTIVKAAGNDRGAGYNAGGVFGTTGYNLVTGAATAKNVLVVAAVNAVTNYTGPSSVVMSSFSSWGPTDDGRIKPDISGCGVNVYSSSSSSNTAYATLSGTSMASPNVTGSLLLIQQHYRNLNAGQTMRSATLRGLVIHTADEAGNAPGPDYRFGWGLLNAQRAVQTITNRGSSAIIDERVLNNGTTYTLNVVASGNAPLEVTIAWNDPRGTPLANGTLNSTSPRLVNDLDVRVTQGSTTFFPWVLNPTAPANAATRGDNIRDNVEKIIIDNPVAGTTYTITISHKGTLSGGSQPYSLIVTGINVAPSTPTCGIPGNLTTSSITSNSATLNWGAVTGASSYDVRIRVVGTSTWTNFTGRTGTSLNVTGLSASTNYEWQIRSNCSSSYSTYSASVTFTTTAPPLTWCASNGNNNSFEWIDLVQLGSINRTSNRETGGYINTGLSTNLTRGTSYTIYYSAGFSSSAYTEYWKVWIDWNRDGDFLDAGEQIVNRTSNSSGTLSTTFTVPSTAVLGVTRMRVSMSDANQNSCGSFAYGEVEDYTINIVASSTRSLALDNSPEDTSRDLEITMYPNPAIQGNDVKIELSCKVAHANIQIFDTSGRIIKQIPIEGSSYMLNTLELKKGIYIIQIVSDKNKLTKKLVVD